MVICRITGVVTGVAAKGVGAATEVGVGIVVRRITVEAEADVGTDWTVGKGAGTGKLADAPANEGVADSAA